MQPLPLYQQVKKFVLDGIATGRYKPGDKIPSEHEFVAALGSSRLTVNRALRELADTGVLERQHGVGTFVAPPKVSATFIRFHNIADEIRERGQTLSIRVHKLAKAKAGAEIAATFGVKKGGIIFHSLIVYCADGIPLQLEDRYVSPAFAPLYLMQDFTRQSTTDYLQGIALPSKALHEIQAVLPSADETTLLDVTGPDAFLVILRKTWVKESVTTFTRFVHPGSRQKFMGQATLDSVQR